MTKLAMYFLVACLVAMVTATVSRSADRTLGSNEVLVLVSDAYGNWIQVNPPKPEAAPSETMIDYNMFTNWVGTTIQFNGNHGGVNGWTSQNIRIRGDYIPTSSPSNVVAWLGNVGTEPFIMSKFYENGVSRFTFDYAARGSVWTNDSAIQVWTGDSTNWSLYGAWTNNGFVDGYVWINTNVILNITTGIYVKVSRANLLNNAMTGLNDFKVYR